LMQEIKDNPSFRQRVEGALKLRFQAFAAAATDMMHGAIVRLRATTGAQRVVVVVDGLEKLTYVREEQREEVEAATETVFVTHASWLRLPVHVIYTFPFWLRFRASKLGALFHGEPAMLPMVKIADSSGAAHADGIHKLAALVGRRVSLARVFGSPREQERTLLPILQASGGYPRDLLRMVREVITDAASLPVTPADTQRVIRQLAQTYARVIRAPDVDLLVEIDRMHTLPGGDDKRLATFSRLFDRQLVLAYLNGEEWYAVHPLARLAPEVQRRLTVAP
jgi:hypothetical protein